MQLIKQRRIRKRIKQNKKNGKLNKVLKSIANIFIPLIPAFIGAGLIGGIAAVLSNLMVAGYISGAWITQLITVFNVIKDGMLAYLAISLVLMRLKNLVRHQDLVA